MVTDPDRDDSDVMAHNRRLRPLHALDRGLLHVCELFFGPRDSWKWWQRKLARLR